MARDRTLGGKIAMVSAWIPTARAAEVSAERDRLAEDLAGMYGDKKVADSDVVRAALICFLDQSDTRREVYFGQARLEQP